MQTWYAEYDDGDTLQFVVREDEEGAPPRRAAMRETQTPRYGLPYERWDWDASKWRADARQLEATLLAQIEAARATRTLAVLATPPERAEEYAGKAREAFGTPGIWLAAEAEASGRTIEAVRDEVIARIEQKQALAARIAAAARAAERQVQDAATAEAKLAAFNAIQWPELGDDQ